MFTLFDYQQECEQAVIDHRKQGILQQLVVMATGTGKTVVFSSIIKRMLPLLGGKVLVFAHREELVDQAIDAIREMNPGLKVGKEMANDWADIDCDVVVSCVASIGRAGSTRLTRFGSFNLVICDEAHHSIAQSYLNVFETTGVLKPDSKALLIGFTATPKRRNLTRAEKKTVTLDDEQILSLKSVYKKIVYSFDLRTAVKKGWLAPPRGFRVKTETSLDNVKVTAGDFQQDQLSEAVNTPVRNAQVVDAWEQYGEGRQTVGFTVDINHAKDLAKAFQNRGHRFEAVWGNDPDRSEKLRQHKSKLITGLLNAQVLTEGYDDWQVSCVISAAPTQSPTKYPQEIGRGTRLQKGAGNLLEAIQKGYALSKVDCIVIDIVDNYRRNTLSTLPSLVGLNPEFDLGGESAIKAVEKLEELQEKYPGVNFTHLTDLSKVKAYVESIDLFADPYTDEIKQFSEFTWMPLQDGSFVLSIPEDQELVKQKRYSQFKHEKLFIRSNELSEYEVWHKKSQNEKKLIEFSTLEEAFAEADAIMKRSPRVANRLKPITRTAAWLEYAATPAAKKYLSKLARGKYVNWCLCDRFGNAGETCTVCQKPMGVTAGQVATAINRLKAK
jgi:superfamily II DNA or RNA helicase